MPATLSSIKGKVTELSVYLGDPETPEAERSADDSFTLWYRQHNLTGKVEALAREAEKDGRVLEAVCETCVPVFVSWDLKPGASEEQIERLDHAHNAGDAEAIAAIEAEIRETTEQQEPIPITKEGLMNNVPISVLVLILTQINESRRPNDSATGSQSRRR